jgi:hypothetical protein
MNSAKCPAMSRVEKLQKFESLTSPNFSELRLGQT